MALIKHYGEESGDGDDYTGLDVTTDEDRTVNFCTWSHDGGKDLSANDTRLDRDAVAAIVAQLQSWLERTKEKKPRGKR